ncbi:clp1-related protein, putative [Plasmodium sp. DRC-Itaito]|nr:clp1-related protein, putative [Plasmodium sp. DRC-Itaito]
MANNGNTRLYHLKAYHELRIVTLEKSTKYNEKEECIKIRVLSNKNIHNKSNDNINYSAEIFGKELIIDKEYTFGYNEKFSIYTYTGCYIQIKGMTLQEYESKNNTMKEYVSLCYILDAYRKLAKKKKKIGPRILITGNNNSGKSSVSLLLLNYALKSGFKPLYIETDTKASSDKIELNRGPGVISCFKYDNMNNIENIYPMAATNNTNINININNNNNMNTNNINNMNNINNINNNNNINNMNSMNSNNNSGNTFDLINNNNMFGSYMKYSLEYFFGYYDIKEDINLYYHLNECVSSCIYLMFLNNINNLSADLRNYSNEQEHICSSGFILNVPSEADHDIIKNLIDIYNINIVIVIDNSFLHYSLKEHYHNVKEDEQQYNNVDPQNNLIKDKKSRQSKRLSEHHSLYDMNVVKDTSLNNDKRISIYFNKNKDEEVLYDGEKNEELKTDDYNNINMNNKKDSIYNMENMYSHYEEDDEDKKNIQIIGMPKFEGVIPSDNNRIKYCRNLWYYNYFSRDININNYLFKKSHIISFKYSRTSFIKLDTNLAVPLSALPSDCRDIKRENVSVSYYNGNVKNLMNCILAVSYSKDFSYLHLINIAALVHVQGIKEIEQTQQEQDNQKENNNSYDNNDENNNEHNHNQVDYIFDILCPIYITLKNLPPFFIIPGNIRQMKF